MSTPGHTEHAAVINRDPDPGIIGVVGTVTVIVVVVTILVITGLFHAYTEWHTDSLLDNPEFRTPRATDDQKAALNSPKALDKSKGILRVPIDLAKELVREEMAREQAAAAPANPPDHGHGPDHH